MQTMVSSQSSVIQTQDSMDHTVGLPDAPIVDRFAYRVLKRALGWEPVVPLEDIVYGYIAWAQAQPGFRDYYAEAERVMKQMGTVRRVMG